MYMIIKQQNPSRVDLVGLLLRVPNLRHLESSMKTCSFLYKYKPTEVYCYRA